MQREFDDWAARSRHAPLVPRLTGPFLSVVVPTRNRAALLRDCLASLVNQNFPADWYEIVVVDDGSTDGTPAVVADVSGRSKSPEVRYLRSEGRGLNAARNAALQAAMGDPIAFVDDDVVAPASWVNAIARGSLRHPEADCLGGPVRLRLEGKAPRLCSRDPLGETELDLGAVERPVDFVCGANMALRLAAIERAGQFNEALRRSGSADELEWELRLLRAGGRIFYLPEAWVWHRRTASDLRLGSLLRAQFRRGAEYAAFARVVGARVKVSQELIAIPRFVAHAVRRGCAGGLLSVSVRAGRAWGITRQRSLLATEFLKSVGAGLLGRTARRRPL